jgi:hypothetical protein
MQENLQVREEWRHAGEETEKVRNVDSLFPVI